MAFSADKKHHFPAHGATAAPPPTPSTQPSHLSTPEDADALSRLLHRLPPNLSLPSRRSSPLSSAAATAALPLVSLSDLNPTLHADLLSAASENGFFQLTNHSVSSELPSYAESDSISLFDLPHNQKLQSIPTAWPLGFDGHDNDDDDDGENPTAGESICLDSSCSTESTQLSLSSLREFTREMERLGLDLVGKLSCAVGFNNPVDEDPTRVCSLMWISEYPYANKQPEPGRLYPYIIGLDYQIRVQKYYLLSDSGWPGWVLVSPQVDSVLVTIGDIAQVWSNGKLKKVRGRPIPTSKSITMSLLLTLSPETTVSPVLPKVVASVSGDIDGDEVEGEEARGERKFESFSFEDYAWRIYHERLHIKDPLSRYRITA